MGRDTDSWPAWDGAMPLQDRRIRLNYPNGRAYAVGVARRLERGYVLEGTGIYLHGPTARVQVAPEGVR